MRLWAHQYPGVNRSPATGQEARTRDVKMPVPTWMSWLCLPWWPCIMAFSSGVFGVSVQKLEPDQGTGARPSGQAQSKVGFPQPDWTWRWRRNPPRKKRYSNSKIIESWTASHRPKKKKKKKWNNSVLLFLINWAKLFLKNDYSSSQWAGKFIVVQSLSCVWLFATPWTAARQASLSSWSLLKLMSTESVLPSNHLIFCHPLLLPSVFPSIRVFSNEYSWLISFRIDSFDLLVVQGTFKSLLQHHNSKASIPRKIINESIIWSSPSRGEFSNMYQQAE